MSELSVGDLQRREKALEEMRAAREAVTDEEATFRPAINSIPGVESRLKVASAPDSYLMRVRQHMKLKEKVTQCVREVEEKRIMQECTFTPQTHNAPPYISRIARSMKIAKSAAAVPPPTRPDWR